MGDSAFSAEQMRVRQLAIKVMQESMYMIQADTQELCPVKTGNLKRSYTSGVEDSDVITGWVGSDCEYAIWADLKHPHLSAAVDKDKAAVERKIKETLEDE